jgi:hypothetical protein
MLQPSFPVLIPSPALPYLSPGHPAGCEATPGFEGCQAVPRLGPQQTFFSGLHGDGPRAQHR